MMDDEWKDIWFAIYIALISTSVTLTLFLIYEAWR